MLVLHRILDGYMPPAPPPEREPRQVSQGAGKYKKNRIQLIEITHMIITETT
jgi:hypothetical protein